MKNNFPSFLTLIALCILIPSAWAALTPRSIPRSATETYVTDGLFEGGSSKRANLESLRLAEHMQTAQSGDSKGYERWVIDFSDVVSRQMGLVAPKFQIRYLKQESAKLSDGRTFVRKAPKFIFFFRSISRNYLDQEKVRALARQSHFVKDIILYPPIEEGDMAMEFILKEDIQFETHQPLQREGRLVLDLKAIAATN